jgi:hypothetical protein
MVCVGISRHVLFSELTLADVPALHPLTCLTVFPARVTIDGPQVLNVEPRHPNLV